MEIIRDIEILSIDSTDKDTLRMFCTLYAQNAE